MKASINIRDARSSDEADWRRLWEGYGVFYETGIAPEITSLTWRRILDPDSRVIGRIAEDEGRVVGLSVSVLHDGTWASGPVCYLEDLFVDPACRRKGLGRQLIQDLVDLGRERNWSSLYWVTRANNPARRLYDEFVQADDFVRYRMQL